MNLKELTLAAPLIVLGDVTNIVSKQDSKLAVIKATKILKGELKENIVKIHFDWVFKPASTQYMTSVEGEAHHIRSMLQFAKDEEVLVFLAASSTDTFDVMNCSFGKLRVLVDESQQKRVITSLPKWPVPLEGLKENEPLENITSLIEQYLGRGKGGTETRSP